MSYAYNTVKLIVDDLLFVFGGKMVYKIIVAVI